MNRLKLVIVGALLLLGLWRPALPTHAQEARPRKILVVTHSAGFRHSVVTRKTTEQLNLVEQIVEMLGKNSGAFETAFVYSAEECRQVTPEVLNSYDGVFFFTSGELPFPEETKKALIEFVRIGKAFVAAHNTTNTFTSFPEFGEMIGGYFDGHPWNQKARIIVEDRSHPATQHLGDAFETTDAIYQFKAPWSQQNVRVLLSLDNSSVDLNKRGVHRTDKDFALAWVREYGKGRVFYSALGHFEANWQDKRFQQHLLGGILWALGDLPGDATPRPRPEETARPESRQPETHR